MKSEHVLDELARLEAAAKQADAATPEPGAAPPGEVPGPGRGPLALTPAEEWSQVPAIFGTVVGRFFPEVKEIYSEEANLKWGTEMVPLAERYGWTASKFFAWLGPWVGVGIATEALVTPTYQALAKRVRDARAEREKKEKGDTPAAP
jgi:hypothetical protein